MKRQMIKIGNISLDVPFFQAALSGYSDYAMRKLARDFGCPFTFAGVVLDKSAAHPKVLSKGILNPKDDEHPIGGQLLGNDPQTMVKAAKGLISAGYDVIDLNFACPAPKVLRRQRGGYLMSEPKTAIEIYRRVREAISCPLMVKLRSGYDDSEFSTENFWQIAETICKEGIDGVILHPRKSLQKFTGTADWSVLAELKKKFPKTIIFGSGDLFEFSDIINKLNTSGIDGVVLARGAVGNPWIFRQLRCHFQGKPIPALPTLQEQKETILEHLRLLQQIYEGGKSVRYFRKFLANYSQLHPQRRKTQRALMAAKNEQELTASIEQLYNL